MNESLVEIAVGALVHFAAPSDRSDAEFFLGLWPRREELSDEDRAAVLDRFGLQPDPVPGLDFLPMNGTEPLGVFPMLPTFTADELAGIAASVESTPESTEQTHSTDRDDWAHESPITDEPLPAHVEGHRLGRSVTA